MNIAEISIKKRVTTLVVTTLLVIGGYQAYNSLGRLEDPEFTVKNAQVFTAYPGASPQQVEEEVTDVIETAVQQMGQLKMVESTSEAGVSTVLVEIKDKYDKATLPQVWDELRRKVTDAQGDLPPGAGPSVVFDDFGDVFGIFFCVYGDGYTYAQLKDYAKMLRRELLLCQDVAKVNIFADQAEVVNVEISLSRLSQLGLSVDTILSSLQGQNLVVPGGKVKIDNKYMRIQPTGEFGTLDDVRNLLILQPNGQPSKLRLGDIASIVRDYQDPPKRIVRFNGKRGIGIGISTVSGGNVVTMGGALKERMQELIKTTPIGIEFGKISIQSDSVTTSIDSFVISLVEAIAIVVGVLVFAMGFRSGAIIGGILLITVMATMILMKINGVALERISLGALIIALGMLVDNAIVVVEGILMNAKKGMSKTEAATSIVQQTMWPLFGATVIAVLAFAAIGVSQDSTGEFCRSLFQVILYSLMLSWVLAITTTPLAGVMFLKVEKQADGEDPYAGKFFVVYRAFLATCIRRRWLTVAILLIALVASLAGFTKVKQSFFPPSTRPQFMVHYWMPQGTHISKTEKDMAKLEEFLLARDDVKDVASFVGGGALRFILTYTPEDANSAYGLLLVGVDDAKAIEQLMADTVAFTDVECPDAQVFSRKFVLGPGDPSKIQVRFRGPDYDVLRRLAKEAKNILYAEETIGDISDDWRQRVPLIRPIVAEAQARNAGITRSQISEVIQQTFDGRRVNVFRDGDELLPIILRSTEAERTSIDSLQQIQIWSPVAGKSIPLSQVVLGYETVSENSMIKRRDRVPTITVKCDPSVGEATTALKKIMPVMEARYAELEEEWGLTDYTMAWGGEYEDSGDAQAALAGNLPLTGVMMVLITIILFNSLKKPLIIFLTVPLCIIGVTWGLLFSGQPFGFMALLGLLSLVGMLIKNTIVLIDEMTVQMAEGKDPYEAILDSGVSRARPVSMAALTTVLGMIPLLVDAFFVSMAVTIMVGLTFATILTLVVVPVFYAIVFRIPSPASES